MKSTFEKDLERYSEIQDKRAMQYDLTAFDMKNEIDKAKQLIEEQGATDALFSVISDAFKAGFVRGIRYAENQKD